ncbi:adenosine kinase [Luminiphilus syltensis]|uniref:adenosine kinase n=1 Tax=Luminiphilus syltensis TaxID=1341119 RepID=UPI0002EF1913|nr:adenosine kinase [Luminiphilus syltensis]
MNHYMAYAIGAALVDTEIEVNDDDLEAMNVEKGMMTLVDEARQAELLGHLSDHLIRANHASGGSAGNSMIASALFGAPTFMSCKVAEDEDGDIYLNDLLQSGVGHGLDDKRQPGTTGKCLVLITPDAERSMNTFLGTSETLSVNEIDRDALIASHWTYLEGYLVTSPTGHEAAVRTREIAQEHGVKTALSFSDPGMVAHFRDQMAAIIGDGLDMIFCNEAEALEWGNTEDLETAMEAIKAVAKTFVVTRGARGALAFDGNHLVDVPAHKVDAVNTNGAGDMFAGAFMYALYRGEDYARATQFAVRAAGEVVKYYGPRLAPEGYRALRQEFFGD